MAETENSSEPIKEEILAYYKELQLGSPKAMAVMDSIREVDLSILIEGDSVFANQGHDMNQINAYQVKLNQHIAQIAQRREAIFDRIQTIEGYASEYENANTFISELRNTIAGQRDPADMNVSSDVTEFFTLKVIRPILDIKADVTAP
jgi:hypothetical protein